MDDGRRSLEEIEQIALGRRSLTLSEDEERAVTRAHAFLCEAIDQRRRIYGVTTGYGPLATTNVDPKQSALLQQNLVYHLCSGVGEPLSLRHVRAMMVARLTSLVRGHSGANPVLIDRLQAWLDVDLVPEVPARGTVGASGDLTPLAHLARALSGEGRVSLRGGRWIPSREAHQQLGWKPLVLRGKDAIALVNGTSATAGIAALNATAAQRALKLSTLLVLLYAELLAGHREAFHPAIGELRPHPGQRQLHHWLWSLSADSGALTPWQPTPEPLPDMPDNIEQHRPLPQDAYTLRCAPQALGAVWDVVEQHAQTARIELEAVTDNPLLFADDDLVLHGGNFFGQQLAFASDYLNNALIQMALYSERRIARITDPAKNKGLPAFMQPLDTGLHSGFMGAQVSATALVAELRSQAMPASIQSIPTNADNQDIVPLGTIAARRASNSLEQLYQVLAIEALVLVQGAELKNMSSLSLASRSLCTWVRELAAPLEQDRPLAEDIARLAQALADPDKTASLTALLDAEG
ncbi:aromatic amino acid ammonia-lyase [Halomonas sp. CUBES01]|uniref:Aromatic amino acid ammonia-lyase n=1 Tax=Vreelandella gomseomensis TaxID=370766 RepID=A0ABU1GD87_9GAMM|nr:MULTISPECIES: aromatic amino acid ammonia-lyase [Halomonas]MDR5875454.1 aromatic amino acid ammonia-lyase [Halomonas gomseomensis]MEC4766291.1 aromatic amino acid ammonia-lyase [Halomonas sp. CUBES01]